MPHRPDESSVPAAHAPVPGPASDAATADATTTNPTAFKHWFNRTATAQLADRVRAVHPSFRAEVFHAGLAALETLELKDRVRLITAALEPALALPFPDAAKVLVAILPPPIDPSIPNQHAFWVWPCVHYIGRFGQEHPDAALDALYRMTQRMSAEFDIRPFLKGSPELTLARLALWAADPSEHVRRLVSEGTRTRLPWGDRLPDFIADPTPVFGLLEQLRFDSSPYVRRSVANNLNDLSKDHPERTIGIAARWLAEAPVSARENTAAIVRHALRSLIKSGHPSALALLGHGTADGLTARLLVASTAAIGETVTLSITVASTRPADVSAAVDLVVAYASVGAKRRTKVFKGKVVVVPAGGEVAIIHRLPLRSVSIRTIYPGRHTIGVQVNGAVLAEGDVQVV